jgi:hypothetical protein
LFAGYAPAFSVANDRARFTPMDWRLFKLYRRYSGRRYGSGFTAFRAQMHKFLLRTNGDLFAVVRLFESCCQLPNNFVMKVEKVSMAGRCAYQ